MSKLKLYIGCSLNASTEKFRDDVEVLKNKLRKLGYEVFDFVGLVNGTPKEVFEWDIKHCVKNCDAFIGICDFPSIGLGYELGEAANLRKPILTLAQQNTKITRFVTGASESIDNFDFKRYKVLVGDAPYISDRWLKSL